jgi:hypothetical protein
LLLQFVILAQHGSLGWNRHKAIISLSMKAKRRLHPQLRVAQGAMRFTCWRGLQRNPH